jgi:hypothetical protein
MITLHKVSDGAKTEASDWMLDTSFFCVTPGVMAYDVFKITTGYTNVSDNCLSFIPQVTYAVSEHYFSNVFWS